MTTELEQLVMRLRDACVGQPAKIPWPHRLLHDAADAIESLSDAIESLSKDAARIDWLADPKNEIGNVQLPKACVHRNLGSLRDAIDMAMAVDSEHNKRYTETRSRA